MKSNCKKCRIAGEKLFLKGDKCFSPSCPLLKKKEKRVRGQKVSSFKKQIIEKRKIKIYYGLSERQLRRFYELALKKKESTPEALAQLLESRLDSVIFRLGFANSKKAARQLVSYGHFLLNNRRCDIPSRIVKPNDVISIRQRSLKSKVFEEVREKIKKITPPSYLELDKEKLIAKLIKTPDVNELNLPFDFKIIIEAYA
ncbi:MAG TPA: 30S ribosomal protein S4 [Candidatus Paceibacterota bacterium]|nr:30S ribosomal protein S4 [Candidatus Paceibacterota bacterium]HOK97178.1 30S ribosomal protein S4 [Candidatus Paceibacterota bacterium]HPP64631.1 30S ribosomal protein S4 [Candidatus Paceibacterota bacterium]